MPNAYPQARPTYTPPTPPEKYDRGWLATALGNLARSDPQAGRDVTANSVLSGTDDLTVVVFDATAGAIDFTLLPAEQWARGKCWLLQKDNSGNDVTLIGTVSGVVDPTLGGQYNGLVLFCDGTAYYSLGTF